MFEFLFKRPEDKPRTVPEFAALGQGDGHDGPAPDGPQPDPARAASAQRLAALGEDEAAVADFILHCEFSELRLAAAERIYSPEHLERVYAAMRNSDRRVAKLAHARLETIRHHQAELKRGEECIELARQLARDERLTPNQVADLDRKWSVIAAPSLAPQFDEVRATLARRLEQQVAQQRRVIDSLGAARAALAAGVSAPAPRQRFEATPAGLQGALREAETAALPRHLLADANAMLDQGRAALAAAAAPAQPGAVVPAQAGAVVPAEAGTHAEPARAETVDLSQAGAPGQAHAPAGPSTTHAEPPPGEPGTARAHEGDQAPRPRKTRPSLPPPDPAFLARMDALDAALAEGALHTASDLDKALKETRGIKLSAAQAERLAHARSELKRLSDWARWGGNVSREEMIHSAEQLQQEKMPMGELAQKVSGLRERWKKLDSVSGAAPKGLWERFDAACTAAYAPAAAHFKHLAEERHASAAKAQALLAEARREAEALAAQPGHDWKHLAATVQRVTQAWSHLGPIDRKEKKRLEAEFAAVMQQLQAPLAEQRTQERSHREALIDEVRAIDPQDRHCLDQLRAAQERWQQAARTLPLERKQEQALWQQFRAACDDVFARRKEGAHAADAERRAHLHAREAICERLEQAGEAEDVGRLLREAASQWHAAGPVPRASEQRIERRYQAAVSALQHRIDVARREASLAQAAVLRDRLRLVQELENALAAQGEVDGAGFRTRWEALPPLPGQPGQLLAARFDAALAATGAGRDAYRALLERNRDRLLQDLLRLEVAAGIDSGAEFARERLKLQVEALQSSLKSGQRPSSTASQFNELLALPALSDARTARRIEQLYPRIGKDHK